MIELAFGAAHREWPNSIVGGRLGASTGVVGVLPKQVLAFRKGFVYRARGGFGGFGQAAVSAQLGGQLYQRYFPLEIGLFLGIEGQSDAARCRDAFQHRKRVPRVFRVLQAGNH
jgi:hypothetical protein